MLLLRGGESQLVPRLEQVLRRAHQRELGVGRLQATLERRASRVAPPKLGLHLTQQLLGALRLAGRSRGAQVGGLRRLALRNTLRLERLQPLRLGLGSGLGSGLGLGLGLKLGLGLGLKLG